MDSSRSLNSNLLQGAGEYTPQHWYQLNQSVLLVRPDSFVRFLFTATLLIVGKCRVFLHSIFIFDCLEIV